MLKPDRKLLRQIPHKNCSDLWFLIPISNPFKESNPQSFHQSRWLWNAFWEGCAWTSPTKFQVFKKEGGSQEVRLRWYVFCGFLQRRYFVGGDTRLEQRLVPHKTQMLKSVFYTHCRAESSLLFQSRFNCCLEATLKTSMEDTCLCNSPSHFPSDMLCISWRTMYLQNCTCLTRRPSAESKEGVLV